MKKYEIEGWRYKRGMALLATAAMAVKAMGIDNTDDIAGTLYAAEELLSVDEGTEEEEEG